MSDDDFITDDDETQDEGKVSDEDQADDPEQDPPAEDVPDLPHGGKDFLDTTSPYGAASYTRDEMGKILGRSVGKKTADYMNALTRDSRREELELSVKNLVDRMSVHTEVKERLVQAILAIARKSQAKADVNMNEAICHAAVRVMQGYGWSIEKIKRHLAEVGYSVVAKVRNLKLAVISNGGPIEVLIGGVPRHYKVMENRTHKVLTIHLYDTDDNKILEVKGAHICIAPKNGESVCPTEMRRLDLIDEHRARLSVGRSFMITKIMKKVEVHGEGDIDKMIAATRDGRLEAAMRRYSLDKLPLTLYFAKQAGVLQQLRAKYYEYLRNELDKEALKSRIKEADGKPVMSTPLTVAKNALLRADSEIFSKLPKGKKLEIKTLALGDAQGRLSRQDLRWVGEKGVVVQSELKSWGG